MVSDTSSHSLGWRGKDALLDLQALTAQVKKLRVKTFIVTVENVREGISGFEVVTLWGGGKLFLRWQMVG
jgi:hypothetical protein